MIDVKNGDGPAVVKWILNKDLYKVQRWPRDYFDYVFDLGAHIGAFSLVTRILNPNAKIIAVEPGTMQQKLLEQNLGLLNVKIVKKAIGDGNKVVYNEISKRLGTSYCLESDKGSIETINFSDLFLSSGCSFDKKYFLKLDCEGCEKYIFFKDKNKELVKQILKNSVQITFEVHFASRSSVDKNWLEWQVYDDWIRNLMSETHEIEYYKSRKHSGYGHYCITNRNHLSEIIDDKVYF